MPLRPGTDGAGFRQAWDSTGLPALAAFAPELLIISAGFDAHRADPLANLKVSVDAQRRVAEIVHDLAHEVAGGRWLALGGGGYAVVEVVPRAWTNLIAIAGHITLDPATPLPAGWRSDVQQRWGRTPPELMTDGADLAYRDWRDGYDPSDDVDRAIRATRDAVFPHLGLDPNYD